MEKQDEGQSLSLKDVYTEMGINYRYFLGWRQRLLAGYLATVAALAIAYAWTYKEAKPLSWVVLATGSGLTIVFWFLDYRNRDLYHACQNSGEALEKAGGISAEQGIYSRLNKLQVRITHSRTLDIMFVVIALCFLAGAIYARITFK